MADEVDTLLDRMRICYGQGRPARDGNSAAAATVSEHLNATANPAPQTTSAATTAYTAANRDQISTINSLTDRDTAIGKIVDESARATDAGRAAIGTTSDQYQAAKTAIAPAAGTPTGSMALLKLKHAKVSQGHGIVASDTERAAARAALVRKLAEDYIRRVRSATPMPQFTQQAPFGGVPGQAAFAGMPGQAPFAGATGFNPAMSATPSIPATALMASPTPRTTPRRRSHTASGQARLVDRRTPSPSAAQAGRRVVDAARGALGLPYVWGAEGPDSYDCSGLAQMSVAKATDGHLVMPRTTYDQINLGDRVDPRDVQPGDLVFCNFSDRGPEHVQIYAGDGRVIEAQQSGVPVKYSTFNPAGAVIKRVVE
ncbi:C40 family peptidase [Aldersonia sp. NBC_00410]|uniref:C40 family peptidase n=1 Tax=Aldersonia sp. NBC_00410 TaxID=2975954 RepID=UPI0022593429|nr:C40 family peptidase [Aldersonia sp. NBC_00410]MCX5046266.1 C40 family peptidase [Aldersonia sp. NBC_00410]